MKKLSIICLSCLLYLNAATGQVITQPAGGTGVFGTVKDQRSNMAVTYVSVSIKNEASKIISGGITDEHGMFRLDGIPTGTFNVELSIVGYQTLIRPLIIVPSTKKLDLGILLLQPDATQLKEVNVTTEKSAISLKLDKKVFEVGKDILAQGGSVNDILNSVPSVAVNPAGAVSLRGNNNVLVMINGRRSGLTQSNSLDQIPAGQIERVEVITNPSSRYDAAGSAGIINIVMKKNKAGGFSGQLRMVGGIPNDSRINPSLNYKSDKFNLFSTFGIRKTDYKGLYTTNQSSTRDVNIQSSNTQNINAQDINSQDIITYIDQVQHEKRHDDGKLLYLGGDYFIDAQNTITAAFYKNSTHDHDKTSLNYNYMNQDKSTDSTRIRNGESWERRNYNQFEFNYTRTFKQAGKKLTVDMQYDFWNSDKDWQLDTRKVLPVAETLTPIRTSSIGASKDFLIQTDFVQPLNEKATFEMGLKAENRKVSSDFKAEQQDGEEWQIFNNIKNRMEYNELIGSAYIQLGSKINKFSYLVGLRNELTRIRIRERLNNYENNKNYNRLFPTLNLSYQLIESATIQASYSKRINRPSLQLLYPFNELTDLSTQYIGNPDLNPSYADVFELGFLRNWSLVTFNPSLYYQKTNGFIQDYTYRNQAGVFITSPVNIDAEIRRGLELSLLYKPFNGIQLNAEFNIYRFEQRGIYQEHNFYFAGHTSTTRINTQVKLPANFNFQLRYNLNGAQGNAQRHTGPVYFVDTGLSKKILKDKAVLTADITNVFNSRQYDTRTTGNNYVITQNNNPNAARYRLSFVYSFHQKEGQAVRQAKSGNRN